MATFIVTTLDDSGPGSLRQAILNANATVGPDCICFAEDVCGTICLLSSLPPITDDVVIEGPGASRVAVSGQGQVPVLSVAAGVDAALSGLTIRDGRGQDGGGIVNRGRLRITSCVLMGNEAAGNGGALFNETGILILERVTLSANQAGGGGGAIFNRQGRVAVLDSAFTTNQASQGGAIGDIAGLVTLERCQFRENQAATGGAIRQIRDRVAVWDGSFTGNSASGNGGAIQSGGMTELKSVSLKQNSAGGAGGAVQVLDGALLVTGSRLEQNSAGGAGGAVHMLQGTVELRTTRLAGNSSGDAGGALAVSAILIINHSGLLEDCDLEGNRARQGGGIFVVGANVRVVRSNIARNTALEGGGGIAVRLGGVELEQSAVYRNRARLGGGIFFETDSVQARLVNVTLSGNQADHRGGAVLAAGGLGEISFSTVAENMVVSAGGGVQATGQARVWVRNSVFANTTDGKGRPRPNCTCEIFDLGGNFSTSDSCPGFRVVAPKALRLGRLKLNPPGRTPTHALEKGSVAIDQAANCRDVLDEPVTVDQRGIRRPQGRQCDAGAYERGQAGHRRAH